VNPQICVTGASRLPRFAAGDAKFAIDARGGITIDDDFEAVGLRRNDDVCAILASAEAGFLPGGV